MVRPQRATVVVWRSRTTPFDDDERVALPERPLAALPAAGGGPYCWWQPGRDFAAAVVRLRAQATPGCSRCSPLRPQPGGQYCRSSAGGARTWWSRIRFLVGRVVARDGLDVPDQAHRRRRVRRAAGQAAARLRRAAAGGRRGAAAVRRDASARSARCRPGCTARSGPGRRGPARRRAGTCAHPRARRREQSGGGGSRATAARAQVARRSGAGRDRVMVACR
ncbi:hypothetical protein HBB16_01450 [Pseudonocardia sp. MCCB 268]|nr:hypothetical protein [Pseudonocardia cytotoxica]